MNNLERFYKDLQLIYELILIYEENFSLSLTIFDDDNLKTTSFHFLLQTFIFQAVNLIALHLNCFIVLFYIDKN